MCCCILRRDVNAENDFDTDVRLNGLAKLDWVSCGVLLDAVTAVVDDGMMNFEKDFECESFGVIELHMLKSPRNS